MDDIIIRKAERSDAARLNAALKALSEHMGDAHAARDEDIERCGFGPQASFDSLIAERAGEVVGAAVFSPLFSTTLAGAGIYVSDLWVSERVRRSGLGRRLLVEVVRAGHTKWQAVFLKLSVYHTNEAARAAYDRMGFDEITGESVMILEGGAFDTLWRQP